LLIGDVNEEEELIGVDDDEETIGDIINEELIGEGLFGKIDVVKISSSEIEKQSDDSPEDSSELPRFLIILFLLFFDLLLVFSFFFLFIVENLLYN